MNVWLIKTGEPLPSDEGQRQFRMGCLAAALVKRGHSVLWWTSTFNHVTKMHRSDDDLHYTVSEGYEIQMLRTPGYAKNTSFARILDHLVLARRFRRAVRKKKQPDLIVCAYPTIGLTIESCRFGYLMGIPVVVDIRDLWPDTFPDVVPSRLRPLANWVISLIHRMVGRSLDQATAITGVTSEYVDWALSIAGREHTVRDRDFPLAYMAEEPTLADRGASMEYWAERGLKPKRSEATICFVGTIGRHFDFATVIEAARILQENGTCAQFIICGDGDSLVDTRKLAETCSNVVLPGWVNKSEVWALLRLSTIAIAPYVNNATMSRNIPNKIQEYLSAGLPVVSSLGGNVKRMLDDSGAGVSYSNGNAKELAAIVSRLCEDENYRGSMAENAMLLSLTLSSAEDTYGAFSAHLENVRTYAESAIR